MANPNLKDLPEELVSNISLRLWSDDIQALRLTCKALEQKTLFEWATEYFSERAFVLSTDSLKVLLSIANSVKLRSFLQRIHILTAYFSDSAFKCGRGCPHCTGWQPTIRQREAWRYFSEDQKALKDSSRDKEMLAEALGKLPALSEISLVDSAGAIPLSVDISLLRKVARLCGRNFQLTSEGKIDSKYYKILSHTWSVLTTAIANSGISTFKGFGTGLGRAENQLCVPLDVRFSDTKLECLRTAFKNLEKFRLQITTRLPHDASGVQKSNFLKANPRRVQKFAAVFPSLQTLSLDFDNSPHDSSTFTNFMPNLDLSKMTNLQLNQLYIDRRSLMAVFERLVSVQHLFLSYVDLSKGSWIPILKQLQGMDGHLEHLHLMYLLEANKKAYFLTQPEEDEMAEDDMMFDDMIMGGPEEDFEDGEETDDELPPLETMDGEIVDGDAKPAPGPAPLQATVEDDDAGLTVGSSSNAHLHQTNELLTSSAPPPSTTGTKTSDLQTPKPALPKPHATADHKAPGNEQFPDRGYYCCVRGKEEISKQLKTFIQEYNLGDDFGAPLGAAAAGVMGGGMMGGGAMGGGMMGGGLAIPIPAGHPPGQPPNMNNILNGLAGYLGIPPPPAPNGGGPGQGGNHGGAHHGGGNHGAANINPLNNHLAHAAGGQQGAASTQNNNNNTQAGGSATTGAAPPPHMGAALGVYDGMGGISFEDFMMGGPPPAVGGGAMMDDEWDTDEESEFMSESDE